MTGIQSLLIQHRDDRLIRRANEYKRGLLTDADYCDQVVEIVLQWLVKEQRSQSEEK